jgi:nucleoside-diphosphate-sugar epimerase
VRELGAEPVIADALDAEQVARAVAETEREVIVHELTALAGSLDLRHFARDFEPTNRLRTEATGNLLSAGRAVGVRRFVAQSFAGWNYARSGGPVKSEEDPLDPEPVAPMRSTLAAIRHLEDAVTGADWTEGIVLRYGGFYGPDTSLARGGESTRRAGAGARVAAHRGERPRRQAATPRAALGRPPLGRGGGGGDDDRDQGRLEREGQAGAGLAAAPPELAQRDR